MTAFRRVKGCPHIIGYYGGYIHGEGYHILLEYADKGTLKDYFDIVPPPDNGQDILKFWECMFELAIALRDTHKVKVTDGTPVPKQ
jgi:serine/threonine protein kinase